MQSNELLMRKICVLQKFYKNVYYMHALNILFSNIINKGFLEFDLQIMSKNIGAESD